MADTLPDPRRLLEDPESDLHMRRDLVVTALTPGILYRVQLGLWRWRRRLSALRPA